MIKKKNIFLSFLLFLTGVMSLSGQTSFLDSMNARLRTADDSEKVYLYSKLSLYYLRSSLLTSMNMALRAKAIADSLGSDRLRAEAINRIGTVHYIFHNNEKATAYILQALRIREKIHDSTGIAYSYTNLALIYASNNDFDKALEYNNKSIELKKKLGMDDKLGANYNNMINFYSMKGDLDQALIWGYKTLDFTKKHNQIRSVGDSYLNIGSVYHWMKEYKKAEENYLLSLHIADSLNDTSAIVQSLINLSAVYLDLHDLPNSYKMLKRAEPMVMKYGELSNIRDYYANLYHYYQLNGNMKKAWANMKKYAAYHDSVNSWISLENITNMQIENKAQELSYQIQALQKDRIIKEMTLKKERRRIYAFLGFFFLLILLSVYILAAIRRMNKVKKDLSDKNSNLEEANAKLVESEKKLDSMIRTKDKFFSIIAHDLINPFQPLLGLSELLVTDIDRLSNEEIKKYAGLIKESAIRSFNLLSNLLKWTQSQTGRLSYNPEDIYLSAVVDEIISFYRENARIKKIHLLNHVDKDLIVYADRDLLSSILRNLISNAIKFTGHNGFVKMEAKRTNGYIRVSVEDNGVGISEDKLEKIFDLESATSTKGTENEEGSGLGLILCREFVEKSGGEIWVQSKPGKGSTFFFTIPVSEDQDKKAKK